MPHNFSSRPALKPEPCICTSQRYVVPDSDKIPLVLTILTMKDILVLRPFHIDCGTYKHMQHGYGVKNGAFKLTLSQKSVAEKIVLLTEPVQKQRCSAAYDVVHNSDSSYKHFIDLREELESQGKQLHMSKMFQLRGIECALWPPLYPLTSWCESSLTGHQSRQAAKSFFSAKFLVTVDYAMILSIFNTIDGFSKL